MTVTAKATFNLTYKVAGNSFSLYNVAASLEALGQGTEQNLSPVDKLIRAYLTLLGVDVECPYIRLSDENLIGDALPLDRTYLTFNAENGGALQPATSSANSSGIVQVKTAVDSFPDFYDTSVMVSVAASNTQKGRIFMRFIPDSIVSYPVGLKPTKLWLDAFDNFKKAVIDGKWCIKSLGDANTFKPYKIKQITRNASGENLTVTTQAPYELAVNNTVRISRADGVGFQNGLYIIDTTPTTTTFTLQGTAGTSLVVAKGGTVRKREYQYPVIKTVQFRYVTRRKSGRPFGQPVGRRPRIVPSL